MATWALANPYLVAVILLTGIICTTHLMSKVIGLVSLRSKDSLILSARFTGFERALDRLSSLLPDEDTTSEDELEPDPEEEELEEEVQEAAEDTHEALSPTLYDRLIDLAREE